MHLLRQMAGVTGLVWLLSAGVGLAQNPYYDHTTFPATGTLGTSAGMRAELDLIEAGFAKLPTLLGNASKVIVVNGTATGLTATDAPIASGTTFPAEPTLYSLFIVTDDSASGACDSEGGIGHTLCLWNGTEWLPVVGSSGSSAGLSAVLAVDRIDGDAISQAAAVRIGSESANAYMVTFYDSTDGLVHTCLVSGSLNNCDKIIKLITGKKFAVKNSADTEIFTVLESGAITNISLDAEVTGNAVTLKRYKWLPGAGCSGSTASTIWDLPATNPAVAACRTGTNTTKGVLDFADGANALTAQLTEYLNEDWSGVIEATVIWQSGSTSTNSVVWQIALACASDADSDDPAFTDDAFTADANKGTANQYNATAVNEVVTTGSCVAGDIMHIRIKRDPAHASDTLAATAQLVGVSLKLREIQ